MADIGMPELIIILLIVIVVFGANRLKGIGASLGSGIREFKKAIREDEPPANTTKSDEV